MSNRRPTPLRLYLCSSCHRIHPLPQPPRHNLNPPHLPIFPCGHLPCPRCYGLTPHEHREHIGDILWRELLRCVRTGLWRCSFCARVSLLGDVTQCRFCGEDGRGSGHVLTKEEVQAWRARVVTKWVEWMVARGRWRVLGMVGEEWEAIVEEREGDDEEEEVMRGRGLGRRAR